jgi:hypothetical protein
MQQLCGVCSAFNSRYGHQLLYLSVQNHVVRPVNYTDNLVQSLFPRKPVAL